MSRYRSELDNARAHIRSLWGVIILLSGMMAYAFYGWSQAPKDIDVHVPPDLSGGAHLKVDEIPAANIFTFAYYYWQQINRWRHDGRRDYPANIYQYAPYLTPACQARLTREMQWLASHGELERRIRALFTYPGAAFEPWRVRQLGPDAWVVTLDAVIREHVAGFEVKETWIRYPLRVVRYDVDRKSNPFRLAIDCYADPGPAKLPPPDQKKPSEKASGGSP
ncbi:MAG TPA: TIGR03746 family integrating conjugative element protein [Rhodobacteraceae bacterium]|nr:TIGR03746 family integrating conjugative element protein [Paracoccaceae bacterium]